MTGMMKINGLDAFDTYGLIMLPGCDSELLKLPTRKPGYAYDWGDEDGIETDPDEVPVFERKIYNLPLAILAEGKNDFNTKYAALSNFLMEANEFDLDITHLGRRFKVRFSGLTAFDKITAFKSDGTVGVNITLELTDDRPGEVLLIGTPSAPTLADISLDGNDHPILTWTEGSQGSSAKTGNKIQRKEEGGVFLDLSETTGTATTYTDSTAEIGKLYMYRVATRNTEGYSTWSNIKSIIAYAPITAPTIIVEATGVGENTISIS